MMELRKTSEDLIILPGAIVAGDVRFGKDCSVWFNSVVRGDDGPIVIGDCCHIEDNCTLHGDAVHPTVLGNHVTVGHNAVVHSCRIGDYTLIGMGSVIISGAVIGSRCLVGAGSVVTGRSVFPDGVLIAGNPARIIRPLTEADLAYVTGASEHYAALAQQYRNLAI